MRASQFIEFINLEKIPTLDEQDAIFTHIDLKGSVDTDGEYVENPIKKFRREYRKMIKRSQK